MSTKELTKTYNPLDVEGKWYPEWENSGAFSPSDNTHSFTIMIPPPNVTGILHIGHILNNTVQDVLIRHARMKGKSTLWLPGTDHASIATEAKVTKMLNDNNIDKHKIGRAEFLKHAWKWKEKYGGTILKQLRKMGASCDWSRTKFTMDEDYSKAVTHVFVDLYNAGLIYKGERIINWDPVGLTALSEEEVIFKETLGKLWYFKYPIENSTKYVIVATTRPETMLGDTGIAVNPNDTRYKKLIGKNVVLPITNRKIPIFSDDYVDMKFGTGCVKVTPAHDPNDYEMGQRNNLEIINIMEPNASLNNNVPKKYQNLDRYDARKEIVNDMEKLGLLNKVEDYQNNVGHSERTDAVIEPYLSNQWFLKMDELAQPAIEAIKSGKIKFYPERWTKTYFHWMNNIRDWCISRQLWWGHRIPVWYKDDEIYCGTNPPDGKGWVQEEDVLDTWFSSWLWPFATLGWPEQKEDLEKFYPTQDLVTGPDIIFFWVARMIMAGLYFKKEIPFSNVYFTGLVRDEKGRKMSKSLGNSPDPIDLMEKYGSDALRVGLLMIAPQGLDILFSEDRIENGRNFMNKLWNSARFVLLNLDDKKFSNLNINDIKNIDSTDKWILSRLNRTIEDVDIAYTKYRMNDAVKKVYNFVYNDFCDWYIEFSKSRFYGVNQNDRTIAQSISLHVLKNIIKLLHPYTPYITEEIWSHIKSDTDCLLIQTKWPEFDKDRIDGNIEAEMILIMEVISKIRNIRLNLGVSPKKTAKLFIRGNEKFAKIIKSNAEHLDRLVKIEDVEFGKNIEKPSQSATAVVQNLELFIPLSGLIDVNKEIERLQNQINEYEGRLRSVNGKLSNPNFIQRAPSNVVENEKKKQTNYQNNLDKLIENLSSLES